MNFNDYYYQDKKERDKFIIGENSFKNKGMVVKGSSTSSIISNNINSDNVYWVRNKHVNKIILVKDHNNNGNNNTDYFARSFIYSVGILPLLLVFMTALMAVLPVIAVVAEASDVIFVASVLFSIGAALKATSKLNGYLSYKIFSGDIIKEYNYSPNIIKHSDAGIIVDALNYYGTTEGARGMVLMDNESQRKNNYETILKFLDDDIVRREEDITEIKNRLVYSLRRTDKRDILYNEGAVISREYIFGNGDRKALYAKKPDDDGVGNEPVGIVSTSYLYEIYGNGEGEDKYYEKIFKKLAKLDPRLSNLGKINNSNSWLDMNNKSMDNLSDVFYIIMEDLFDAYYIVEEARSDGLSNGAVELAVFKEIVDVVAPKLEEIEQAIVVNNNDKLLAVRNTLQDNFNAHNN